jgi:hypothetical protein
MIGTGCLEKVLEVISGLPRLAHGVILDSGSELLVEVANLLVVVTLVSAGSDHNSLWLTFSPPFMLLVPLFAPLPVALSGTPRSPPGATFPLSWMKTARSPPH